jgi:shikimate dehydrogenase
VTAETPAAGRTRCAVLGSPIAHSLSPALHRAAYAALGLTGWTYDRYEVDEEGLAPFVTGLDATWRGLSLTKPLKIASLSLGEQDPLVRLAGAANTLILSDSGRHLYNTDVDGLVTAVRAAGVDRVSSVTILGGGGTARAALVSAARLGAGTVHLLLRTLSRADDLRPVAEQLGVELFALAWEGPLPGADLVVSTVSAEAAAARASAIAASAPLVFDALYDPWPTPLAEVVNAAGGRLVSGLDLLVHQAVGQVELMTGRTVPAEVLLSAGRKALSARTGA